MKRRTWRRWPSGDTPRREQGRGGKRGKRGTPNLTTCPVCATPLVTVEHVEQGPHGERKVRLLHCPNEACPRHQLGESSHEWRVASGE